MAFDSRPRKLRMTPASSYATLYLSDLAMIVAANPGHVP